MIASRMGWPSASTGTVPDHWAVQATAATEPAGTVPRPISRADALVIRAHQCPGSCSAPPPGSRVTECVSCSDATTSPAVDTRATFSAEVPRSMARTCCVMPGPRTVSCLDLEQHVEVAGQQLMHDLRVQGGGHAVDRCHPRAHAWVGPDLLH